MFRFSKQVERNISEARKFLDSPIIEPNETSKEITNKIIYIVKKSISECETIKDVCKQIKESINLEFDGFWDCAAYVWDVSDQSLFRDPKFSVKLKFGKLRIWVYRLHDKV